jgi:capsid protein
LRAGKIEFRRDLSQIQWQVMVPMFCEPIWQRFVTMGAAAGLWPAGNHRAEWMPPRNEPIDPKKDTDAEETDVANGFASWSETVRKRGKDPKRHAEELAAERKMLGDLGLEGVIPTNAKAPPATRTSPSTRPRPDANAVRHLERTENAPASHQLRELIACALAATCFVAGPAKPSPRRAAGTP